MLNGNRTKSGRSRHPRDFYVTPQAFADAAIHKLRATGEFANKFPLYVLDAGCGSGVWGRPLSKLMYVCGIDINPQVTDHTIYDEVITGDFLQMKAEIKFDLVYGNPPYSLAEEFVRHSFSLLEDGGRVYFLFRLSFLEGIGRCRGLFQDHPIKRVFVCSRRPSFYSYEEGCHPTDTLSYAMFLWQKGYDGRTEVRYLDWDYK